MQFLIKQFEISMKKVLVRDATWERDQDRAVLANDYVELDIDVIEDPAHNVCSNQMFSVVSGEIAKMALQSCYRHEVRRWKRS